MKVIIAGPRDLRPGVKILIRAVAHCGFPIQEVVAGGQTGVDKQAIRFAKWVGLAHFEMPAPWDDWQELGLKSRGEAGPYRNAKMADYADALIVIKRAGQETRGTSDMIRKAQERHLPIYIEEE